MTKELAFLAELMFALATLAAFAASGGFVLAPFRGRSLALMSPAAGIAIFGLGCGLLYNVLHLPFRESALAVLAAGALMTVATLPRRPAWRDLLLVGIALAVCSIVVAVVSTATIMSGTPSFFAGDGTDPQNYAQVADWITRHRSSD